MSRFNGQIWIDKNSPNRLKYYVNENEYEVVVSQNYEAGDSQVTIPVGSVVALTSDGKISKAHFPNDIDKVIGIAGPCVNGYYPIITSGTLIVGEDVFYDAKEFIKVGCPVYWFIGRTQEKEDNIYETIDCHSDDYSHCGKLTVGTPSGIQWEQSNITDPSFNVGYDNLPLVGVVSKIENKDIYISINFTGFDSTLGWSWPLFGDGTINRDANDSNIRTLKIRHGLFHLNSNSLLRPRCFCSIVALDDGSDTEYQVSAAVDNYYEAPEIEPGDLDRRTEITVKTPDTLRYTIHGTVVYNLGKSVSSEENK